MLAYPDCSVQGVFITDDAHGLSLSSHRDPPLEELHAGLHEVVRLVELEHYLLRGRLDGLKAESEEAHILEGVIVLGAVLNQKLAHLLEICREVGRL